MKRFSIFGVLLPLVVLSPGDSLAQGKSALAREAAESVIGRFGKEAAKESLEGMTRKIESLALKHGDEAVVAVKKVGPRTFRLIEESGEYGAESVKLMARYGDDAVWIVARKNRLAIFVKYGDTAGEAMMKHGEIAEPLLESAGKSAAGAFRSVSPQNGRRLAMMGLDGELSRIGRTPQLLDAVAKYGDPAMEFVWKHKGALQAAAALTAFLDTPEPYLDGTADITNVVAKSAVDPSGDKLVPTAEPAGTLGWPHGTALGLCLVGGYLAVRKARQRNDPTPIVQNPSLDPQSRSDG